MRTATRHHRTEAPAARAAAACDPALPTVDAATRLDGSPRQAAQRALHAAIGHGPRTPHAARLRPAAPPAAAVTTGAASSEVVQRWPMPPLPSLALFAGGVAGVVASAGAWTSLLAMGGGVAVVLAAANEAARAYGAMQPPRDEDIATPDAVLEERAQNAQAQLEAAAAILTSDPEPQQREAAEQQAELAVETQAEAVAVKSSKAKAKRERKKLSKAIGKQEAETETQDKTDPGTEIRTNASSGDSDGEGWSAPKSRKPRKPKKALDEQVEQSFAQALRLTARRDPPYPGRNNGGEVQGFSGIVPFSKEWRWLKDNVEGTIYEGHGLALGQGQTLRWYVTESSKSGFSFDVSLHLFEGEEDTRKTYLVLHVPK